MSDWEETLDWSKSALIVVDMQNDFCHPEGSGARNGGDVTPHKEIVPNIQRVIDACHSADVPVIFIKTTHDDSTNSPSWLSRRKPGAVPTCVTGTWGTEYFGVAPAPGDLEIVKHRYSAFIGTDLELRLRAMGREVLLITGVDTNVCVESTLRDGFMLDFYTVLLEDGAASGSQEFHDGTLASVRRCFGWVSDSQSVAARLDALALVSA